MKYGKPVTLQPGAAAQPGTLLVTSADAIITPLSGLTRVGAPPETGLGEDAGALNTAPPEQDMPNAVLPPAAPPQPQAPEPIERQVTARPSFNCADASTRGELAVCQDTGLAALDRNMAAEYRRAMAGADPAQRALLTRTRDSFLSFRDRCASRGCMTDAYLGRIREIRDIMAGRWRPN
jgi:uncharacterized protein YecT (DUF1311 family)